MNTRSTIINVFLMMCIVILGGCWDRLEVDELAFVTVIGIDLDEENEYMVKITYVIANPEAGAQAGGSAIDEPPVETISLTVEDFNTAKSIANTVVAKTISYDLLDVFMVSEDFARHDDFIRWMYDVTKAHEVRRDIHLIITKESPSTFVQNNQPLLDTRSHKFYEFIIKNGQATGTAPPSQMNHYFQITEANEDLFLGMYATTEDNKNNDGNRDSDQLFAGGLDYEGETNTAEFSGSAVFKEGKMIDILTIEETRLAYLLNIVMDQPNSLIVSLPDNEKYKVSAKINRDSKVELDMNLESNPPSIHVTVPLNVEILTNHSMADLSNDDRARDTLKKQLEQTFNEKFEELIHKVQQEYGGQPFSWSLAARKQFTSIPEFEEYNWKDKFPTMDITVETKITLESFGRQSDLPDLEEVRDE